MAIVVRFRCSGADVGVAWYPVGPLLFRLGLSIAGLPVLHVVQLVNNRLTCVYRAGRLLILARAYIDKCSSIVTAGWSIARHWIIAY